MSKVGHGAAEIKIIHGGSAFALVFSLCPKVAEAKYKGQQEYHSFHSA
jgi:hypothetical protein